MKSEIISGIILFISLVGLGVIVFRKIPILAELPETSPSHFSWRNFLLKMKNLTPFKEFSTELFLQKILSKIRILTLKTDNKTSNWLQRLRERARKKKFGEGDKYWEEVKKTTKE